VSNLFRRNPQQSVPTALAVRAVRVTVRCMQTPKATEISWQELQARRAEHRRQLELVRESILRGVAAPNERRGAA
jgi:hypothetical protein